MFKRTSYIVILIYSDKKMAILPKRDKDKTLMEDFFDLESGGVGLLGRES